MSEFDREIRLRLSVQRALLGAVSSMLAAVWQGRALLEHVDRFGRRVLPVFAVSLTPLMDRLESGDILIVTKLDRLGRDAIDVSTTVKALGEMGVKVYCLAIGGADLTSSSGIVTMQVLNAVAQFERDLLIERTQSGLKRAKSEGKTLGRPSTLNEMHKQGVRDDLAKEMSISAIARKFGTSRQTIMRVRDEDSRSVRA